jgi:hypothetical protein
MRVFLVVICLALGVAVLSVAAIPAATKSVWSIDGAEDGAPRMCHVHNEKMVTGSIPIRYGLIRMYEFKDSEQPERGKLIGEYLRLKKEQFPETRRWVNGGCNPGFLDFAESMTIYHCETCRRLEDEWFAKHPEFLKADKLP